MKKIFLSDLHLMDERSFTTGRGYYWTSKERSKLFAEFLEQEILRKNDIEELIILGDFFENWVCPVDLVPSSFQDIFDNKYYTEIFKNLKRIAESNKNITYIAGNHDLQMDVKTLDSEIPGITFIKGNSKEIVGVYKKDGIHAEHGNRNSFFCGVNPDPDHVLPIGFFLSRFGAQKKMTTRENPDILDIAKQYLPDLFNYIVGEYEKLRSIFKRIILGVANDCGLQEDSEIQMGNLDNWGKSVTVIQVANYFQDIIKRWNDVKPGNLDAWSAISGKIGGLLGKANREVYKNKNETSNIVIYGHDHGPTVLGEKMIGVVPEVEYSRRYAPFI